MPEKRMLNKSVLEAAEERICQPYGDDQRKGLWLFHVIEPETWARVVARVNGANQGALYANESGNILGRIKITKPDNHTWKSFAELLLSSMPEKMSDHYKDKIATFIMWYADKNPRYYIDDVMIANDDDIASFVDEWSPTYNGRLPDEAPHVLEVNKKAPSWRRVCKSLLRNDYWCKGLGFTQQVASNHKNYKKLMEQRRQQWNIYTG